jgi:hypothetical protein
MIDAAANTDSAAALRRAYAGPMKTPLFKSIGKSIAKATGPMDETELPGDSNDDDESSESPGAMLAEALGIPGADVEAIDAALQAAVRQLK